jgi:hypothetical protein
MTEPVNRGGIDPINAAVSAVADGGDRGVIILLAPAEKSAASTNGPCSQTNSGNFDSARAQRPFFQRHGFSFFSSILRLICLRNIPNFKLKILGDPST